MKRPILLASLALCLASHAAAETRPLRVPGIAIVPHPGPWTRDLGTCLMACAEREAACRGARTPGLLSPPRCRMQRSLCDSDCDRYGVGDR